MIRMSSFSFVHAADIHLDSPLQGLSKYDEHLAQRIRGASRQALAELVDLTIQREADFLIIAGDLYDGSWKDSSTGHAFAREMGRLDRAEIPVFVLLGNHDAESKMTRVLEWPVNVRKFRASRPQSIEVEGLDVVLHGQSFKQQDVRDNLAANYPPPQRGKFNIGVLHTALEGNARHASYAPCSLAQLRDAGYDYWALGHVHEHAIYSEFPHVVYPGNLQGRHARETGEKGAVLVKVDEGHIELERLIVDVVRWHDLGVDVSAAENTREVMGLVGTALSAALGGQAEINVFRVRLQGQTIVHEALLQGRSTLRDEVVNQAVQLSDEVLIEKVRIETRAPAQAVSAEELDGALGDFAKTIHALAGDKAFLASLSEDLSVMSGKFRGDCPEDVDELRWLLEQNPGALVEDVIPELIAQIQKGTA